MALVYNTPTQYNVNHDVIVKLTFILFSDLHRHSSDKTFFTDNGKTTMRPSKNNVFINTSLYNDHVTADKNSTDGHPPKRACSFQGFSDDTKTCDVINLPGYRPNTSNDVYNDQPSAGSAVQTTLQQMGTTSPPHQIVYAHPPLRLPRMHSDAKFNVSLNPIFTSEPSLSSAIESQETLFQHGRHPHLGSIQEENDNIRLSRQWVSDLHNSVV